MARRTTRRLYAFGFQPDLSLFHFHYVLDLLTMEILFELHCFLLDKSFESVRSQIVCILSALALGFDEGGEELLHLFGLCAGVLPLDPEGRRLLPLFPHLGSSS